MGKQNPADHGPSMSSAGKKRRRETSEPQQSSKGSKRRATLYDAVAGRVGAGSFLTNAFGLEGWTGTGTVKVREGTAVFPEEVLFRQQRAPIRYEETDTYFAHEKLDPDRQRLPDSDLLKAIHSYTSHFYSRATALGGKWDWRSMDETALLAIGMLLEETIAQDLGPTADLAFVEGDDADTGVQRDGFWDGRSYRPRVLQRMQHGGRSVRETAEGNIEPG